MTQEPAAAPNRDFGFITGLLSINLLEEGAFCHFRSPVDDEPLYLPDARLSDGSMDESKRVGAWVRSTSSKAYDQFLDAVQRRAISQNRKAKTEQLRQELVLKQLKQEGPETFAVLVVDFENTSKAGGRWTPTQEEKTALAADPNNSWICDQVRNFANDQANFGASEATVGNGSAGA